jgi:hypothetical protein
VLLGESFGPDFFVSPFAAILLGAAQMRPIRVRNVATSSTFAVGRGNRGSSEAYRCRTGAGRTNASVRGRRKAWLNGSQGAPGGGKGRATHSANMLCKRFACVWWGRSCWSVKSLASRKWFGCREEEFIGYNVDLDQLVEFEFKYQSYVRRIQLTCLTLSCGRDAPDGGMKRVHAEDGAQCHKT